MLRIVDRHFTVVLAGTLTFFPAFRAVTAGQNTALMLLALAGSWRLVDRDHDLAAGLVLGLAVAKPQLAIALVGLHLLARRWRVVVGAVGGAGLIWGASALVSGVGWLPGWWHQAMAFERVDAAVNGQNAISWLGVGRAVFGVDSAVGALLGWTLAVASVMAVIWTWRHTSRHSLGPAMAVAAAGVVLISPHAMFYDAGLLVLTGLVLADRLGRPGRLVIGAIWLLAFAHPLAGLVGVTPVAACAALAFGVAVIEARRPPFGVPSGRSPGAPDGAVHAPDRAEAHDVDLSVVIPAWNEQDRLGPTLDAVATWLERSPLRAEVIVVDDGSTDDTVRVAESHSHLLPTLRVISLETNRGKGHAVRTGMLAAVGARRLFMDADNATDLSELDRFDRQAPGAPLVIGSIAVDGAQVVVPQPALRRALGRMGNLLIRLSVLPGVRDSQRGFKVFRADVAEVVFSHSVIDGWGFDVEVLGLARVLGFEVRELGVSWSHREASTVRASGYVTTLAELVRIQARLLTMAAVRSDAAHAATELRRRAIAHSAAV
jgi:hypothetical protein